MSYAIINNLSYIIKKNAFAVLFFCAGSKQGVLYLNKGCFSGFLYFSNGYILLTCYIKAVFHLYPAYTSIDSFKED
jgi:hypothetical protein